MDSGASSQKPEQVIEALNNYERHDHSNVHRGVHTLSQRATEAYEASRTKVQQFINAESVKEVVFTRGTTEAINLVAQSYGRANLQSDDEVLITEMEHHANIVPWQLLRDEIGIELKIAPIDKLGDFQLDEFTKLLGKKTRLVSLTHVSNVLGTIVPIKKIIDIAHGMDIPVFIDGAQGIVHTQVDVQELGVDFYAFTGHKLYGPSGIGVLYGKKELLNDMPPYQGGGDMIERVTFENSTYRDAPFRFEAGTPPIAEAAGLAAAVEFVESIGVEKIAAHEQELLSYATKNLNQIDGLKIYGESQQKAGIISFTLDNAHPHDISTIIDSRGVAVRAGHHCAQPLMDWLGIAATTRASFGMYNTKSDVDALLDGLNYVKEIFS